MAKINVTITKEQNERPSRNDVNMAIAQIIASRSTCRRASVGAVIVHNKRIIATGYNGSLHPLRCSHCDLHQGCTDAVHAEANAIAFAAREGIKLDGATLYCTHSPCLGCAKLIIQSGIKMVVYLEEYRIKDGIELLTQKGVSIYKYE
jgi:dCMP deaminase